MKNLRSLLLAAIFSLFALPSMGQCMSYHFESSDTIYAGMENQLIVQDSGNYTQENLGALLTPKYSIDFPPCRHCFGDTIKADKATTDGSLTTLTFDLPMGIYPNAFRLTVLDTISGECRGYSDWVWIVSKPYVFAAPEDQTICYGGDASFEVIAYQPDEVQYQWYLNGRLLEGETASILNIENVDLDDYGNYECRLKNQWGEASAFCSLSLHPYSLDPGIPAGPEQLCMGTDTTSYALPEDPYTETYHWILLPVDAGSLVSDGRNVIVEWNQDFAGEVLLFAETASKDCSGPNSDTLSIHIVGPTQSPEICIVGVDEASAKYRIVWNKMNDASIVGYNIYRESNQAGVFLKLKSFAGDEFSVYVDSSSSPEALPHSYQLSYVDTCGNESEFSPVHTSVHLTANLGTGGENNLSWTHYQGFAFLSYGIYRGTHPDSLQLFQEVSSNVSSFTDLNPPSQRVFYQIVVSRGGVCQPAKKAGIDYSISRSNVFELNALGTDGIQDDQEIKIYPNPAKGFITVSFPDTWGSMGVISIYSISGNLVSTVNADGSSMTLSTDELENGIYLLKLTSERNTFVERFVVRR